MRHIRLSTLFVLFALTLVLFAGSNPVAAQSSPTQQKHERSEPLSCTISFGDVPSSYWAYSYIHALACANIVSGTGGGNFSPDANATRIQFAKMISLARGYSLISPATASFSDVPTSHPLYQYVETAKAQGAINGYTGPTCTNRGVASPCFLPDDNISRAQTALIIVRAYGWPTNTTGGPHFSDVPAGSFFYNAVETAYNRGVINGVGGGRFDPEANITRAQISKMLQLAIEQPSLTTPADYKAVSMASATEGWAVGEGGAIRTYNNGTWSNYPSPTTSRLVAVDSIPGEAWAVGITRIFHMTGGTWQLIATPPLTNTTFVDVASVGPNEAYVLGQEANLYPRAVLLHYNAGSWTTVDVPVAGNDTAVAMSWASRTQGYLLITADLKPGFSVAILYSCSSTACSRDGGVLQGYNRAVTLHANASQVLFSVSYYAPSTETNTLYRNNYDTPVVGCGGSCPGALFYKLLTFGASSYQGLTSAAYYNGTDLLPVVASDLDGLTPNDVWLVGAGGLIRHWNGSTLVQVAP